MSRRHNTYAQILDPASQDAAPADTGMMANVPDIRGMAHSMDRMCNDMKAHADKLHALADLQPDFKDVVDQYSQDGGDGMDSGMM